MGYNNYNQDHFDPVNDNITPEDTDATSIPASLIPSRYFYNHKYCPKHKIHIDLANHTGCYKCVSKEDHG